MKKWGMCTTASPFLKLYQHTKKVPAYKCLLGALYTVAKIRNQNRCPLTGVQIKMCGYIYIVEWINETLAFATK